MVKNMKDLATPKNIAGAIVLALICYLAVTGKLDAAEALTRANDVARQLDATAPDAPQPRPSAEP